MNTPLELSRTRKGSPILVLMGAVPVENGLSAPSGVALTAIRAGTHVLYEQHKYKITTTLTPGTHRPGGGLLLQKVIK